MKNEEKHLLGVAIECDLYDILEEIESSNDENKLSLKEELIQNFIKCYSKSFPDITEQEFRKYIDFVLERTKNNREKLIQNELGEER